MSALKPQQEYTSERLIWIRIKKPDGIPHATFLAGTARCPSQTPVNRLSVH